MCGIAGIAGEADELVVKDMLARIRHRGPDDTGIYATPRNHPGAKVAMGNNRLSILDLSPAGHQPTSNEDGTVWVAYNGEIYNFAELRQELENDGHRFLSHTDTEILPHLYEKYGPDMVNRLNGMFAFALWDGMAERLWLFRDRMGVKPLYYVQVGSQLYFASEIKALLACQPWMWSASPNILRFSTCPTRKQCSRAYSSCLPDIGCSGKRAGFRSNRTGRCDSGRYFRRQRKNFPSSSTRSWSRQFVAN